ncbi:hypothetical protein [Aliikangiella maris]|uniref:Lipoprotein n=2 Tax=Aliikangiella maris TaxID=3162458 RepID=A0ABV2BTQ3_9GAMM
MNHLILRSLWIALIFTVSACQAEETDKTITTTPAGNASSLKNPPEVIERTASISPSSLSQSNATNKPVKPAELDAASHCQIPVVAFSKLTQEVLTGTDMQPLSDFKYQPAEQQTATYSSENGGATLTVKVATEKTSINTQQTTFHITRIYQEPGLPNDIKTYSPVCIQNEKLYHPSLRALTTADSLLWLELDSQNEFISADFWIRLTRQP